MWRLLVSGRPLCSAKTRGGGGARPDESRVLYFPGSGGGCRKDEVVPGYRVLPDLRGHVVLNRKTFSPTHLMERAGEPSPIPSGGNADWRTGARAGSRRCLSVRDRPAMPV
jgi:hypothetical protein